MNASEIMAAPSHFSAVCPGCGISYSVPVDVAGKAVTCESCQTSFILREAASPVTVSQLAAKSGAPQTSVRASLVKNILLLLSGAALVWGVSTFQKKQHTISHAHQPSSGAFPITAAEQDPKASPSLTEPVITTTLPARPRPKLPSAPLVAEPPSPAPPPSQHPVESLPASIVESSPPEPPAGLIPHPSPETGPVPADLSSSPEVKTLPPSPAQPIAAATPVISAASPAIDVAEIRQNSRLTLERFLLAGSIAERLAFSQNPDKVRAAMEQHYRTWPDAPQPLREMAFLTDGLVPDTKRKFHLYNVFLKDEEAPIPLAVEETGDGYRVDWPTYAESYTHALRTFFAAPSEAPGRFRVMLRRAHYFGPPVPGQDTVRIAYTVEPPMRDETFHVWVEKESLVYQEKLAAGERAGWDAESYVMVELLWKGDSKRGRWVGLQRIIADSWRAE